MVPGGMRTIAEMVDSNEAKEAPKDHMIQETNHN